MGALVLNVGVQNMKKVIWNGIIIYNIMYGIVGSEGVMYWWSKKESYERGEVVGHESGG